MIVFENVTKRYKSNIGLDNVSVRINKGEFVFLVGPSGAGKSTFIKLILKEIDADKGSIKVKGQDVTKFSNRQVPKLRRNVGIVFQDFRLLPKKTVFENVSFAMEIVHQSPRKIKMCIRDSLKSFIRFCRWVCRKLHVSQEGFPYRNFRHVMRLQWGRG